MSDKEQVMQRRQFVRLVGGGVVAAATAPLAACSKALPPEAIAAWNGPGTEPDLRRWLLGYAILAPHSHNLQSWVVDLGEPDQILLRCDLDRLLPETDPYSRQIMMSHGTFLELLDMAARERGYRAEITLFPQGAFGPQQLDGRPVARVRLLPDAAAVRDPLFVQVLQRHTNRSAYDLARPVPAAAWQAMAAAVQPHELRFGFAGLEQPEALAQQRAVAAEAWRIEMVTPRTIMESYQVLRVGADEVARHRDGLTLMDPLVVLLDRVGLFDRSHPPAAEDFATTSQIKDFNAKLDSTPGFLWMVSEGNDRVTQVNAGRAFMRVHLAATAQGVALQPLQQALQEYAKQAQTHAQIRRLLGADAPGQTLQMWARVGYAPQVPPAPRRALDAFIQRA
jgi:hypothetical protein